jgi:hypothetical protein
VNNVEHLTRNFNTHRVCKIMIVSEESHFGGDRKTDSILKDMGTSETVQWEPKGLDPRPLRDSSRMIFISNEDQPVNATPDERRYAAFPFSDERIGDEDYFNALVAEIGNGHVASAMRFDLERLDISDFNVRRAPRTKGLEALIIRGLSDRDKWLRAVLETGTFADAAGDSLLTDATRKLWETQSITIRKEAVYSSYRSMVKGYMGKEISTTDIGLFFIGAFKESDESESLIKTTRTGGDPREYSLPPLPELIEAYEAKTRLPLDHDMADLADDADFIRVKNPTFPRAPIKPKRPSSPSEGEAERYDAAMKQVGSRLQLKGVTL